MAFTLGCSKLNRRDFVRISSLGSALAGSGFLWPASLKAADPSVNFPTQPRERLSVSTYPFRSVIKPGPRGHAEASANGSKQQMTLAEFAATIPPQFDVPGIEPWSHHFESVEPEYVRGLAAAFQKAGVHVVNIPCDINVHVCGTAEQLSEALDSYSKWVDAAVLLGSPSIRVHVPESQPMENIKCAVDGLTALAAYGEKQNIVINLENDDPGSENPYRVSKVIEAVNSPWLRSLPDFGNSRQLGDEQYNERALEALFPHAYNISHVKDMETIDGKPLRADVQKIFAIAKKAGYRGYFSMEWDAEGADPYDATKRLIAASLKGLSQ